MNRKASHEWRRSYNNEIMDAYLTRLTARLAEGMARQPDAFRQRHAAYLCACQNTDGGFGGRDPASDLYYTGFGLRGLALMDALTPEVGERAADFLRARLQGSANVVDFFSLLYAAALVQISAGIDVLVAAPVDWPERVAELLSFFRTQDGGFGRVPGATSGSTYHSFLVALCFQLLNRPVPDLDGLVSFIESRRRDDGGFVEIKPMQRGGTNPTAAAVGVLQIAGAVDAETRTGVGNFLAELQTAEGGFGANARAPLADLLSTFTACWTLAELGHGGRIDLDAARTYVRSLDRPEGGFHGGAWDGGFDVEYTFYGLGSVALLDGGRS